MNPNNVIHRRRAARNSVKEGRRSPEGTSPTTPKPVVEEKSSCPRKRKTFFKKKEKTLTQWQGRLTLFCGLNFVT